MKTRFVNKLSHKFAIKGNRDWTIAKRINNIFVNLGATSAPHPYDFYTAHGLYYYLDADNKVRIAKRFDKEIMERIVLSSPNEYYEMVKLIKI